MNPEKMTEVLRIMTDPSKRKEVHEEKELAKAVFEVLFRGLDPIALGRWLYSIEWEDTLVPIRAPKGMADLLKLLDETGIEATTSGRCEGCKAKDSCLLLARNPSELLLTFLLKLAFTEAGKDLI